MCIRIYRHTTRRREIVSVAASDTPLGLLAVRRAEKFDIARAQCAIRGRAVIEIEL